MVEPRSRRFGQAEPSPGRDDDHEREDGERGVQKHAVDAGQFMARMAAPPVALIDAWKSATTGMLRPVEL